jgi:DNA-directed RNA polymerase subunit RPC12/RpoP
MSNTTACPNCGAPFQGASIAGEYRCKFCGNVILLKKDGITTSKSSTQFYQPDPPRSVDLYQENTKKVEPPTVSQPNPIPQEVTDSLNQTRTFLGLARKWTIWIVLGIISICALCTISAVLIFRIGK